MDKGIQRVRTTGANVAGFKVAIAAPLVTEPTHGAFRVSSSNDYQLGISVGYNRLHLDLRELDGCDAMTSAKKSCALDRDDNVKLADRWEH